MSDLLDINTLLSIWTGSAVPIIITFLGYYLVQKADHRRHVLDEKKRIYSELEWAIRKTAQTLNDLRALQVLKTTKSDLKEVQALFMRLASLSSIWLAEGAIDFLRDLMDLALEEKQPKSSESPAQLKKGFEVMKDRMMLELQAFLAKNGDVMSKYSQELQRFQLSKPIQDSLARVWQLFAQMGQTTTASALLVLSGLDALDTGADIGPWVEQMQTALNSLTKALNDDLASGK
jgi:hypothetical protein